MAFASYTVQKCRVSTGFDTDSSQIRTLNDFYSLVNSSLPTLLGSPKGAWIALDSSVVN